MALNLIDNSIRTGVLGIAAAINLAGASIGGRFGEALGDMGSGSSQSAVFQERSIADKAKAVQAPSRSPEGEKTK